jgi:hypothetical protein
VPPIQASHPPAAAKLDSLKRKAKADEKNSTCTSNKIMKQQSIMSATSSAAVTQAKVNKLILDFVVSDMQSFNVVEQPSFINLVTGLQPGKTVMSRKALVGKRFCQNKL